jgi:hypothetical protein
MRLFSAREQTFALRELAEVAGVKLTLIGRYGVISGKV